MELILAIIIGLVLLFRTSSESISRKEARAESRKTIDAFFSHMNWWLNKVTNTEIERNIRNGYSMKDYNLMQELENTKAYYGFSDKDVDSMTAIRILMANRHLLLEGDAKYGIYVMPYGADYEKMFHDNLRFIDCIDQKLAENGASDQRYLRFGNDYYPYGFIRPGHIVWAPVVFCYDIKKSKRELKGVWN